MKRNQIVLIILAGYLLTGFSIGSIGRVSGVGLGQQIATSLWIATLWPALLIGHSHIR